MESLWMVHYGEFALTCLNPW